MDAHGWHLVLRADVPDARGGVAAPRDEHVEVRVQREAVDLSWSKSQIEQVYL